MRPDFSVDWEAFARHTAACVLQPGIVGVLCNGHAGENFVITRVEKRRAVEVTAAAVGASRIVVAGVNQESSLEAAGEAREARAAGADAVMVFLPNAFALAQDDEMAERHHRIIADAVPDLPLFLFQGSVNAGRMAYTSAVLDRLLDIPGIVGIKEGGWEVDAYDALRRQVKARRPEIAVMASGGRASAGPATPMARTVAWSRWPTSCRMRSSRSTPRCAAPTCRPRGRSMSGSRGWPRRSTAPRPGGAGDGADQMVPRRTRPHPLPGGPPAGWAGFAARGGDADGGASARGVFVTQGGSVPAGREKTCPARDGSPLWSALLALLVGLIWIGQGTGVFPYPKESFMIDQRPWAWRGLAVAVAGIVLVGLARAWRSR